jgi:hypothetical protein
LNSVVVKVSLRSKERTSYVESMTICSVVLATEPFGGFSATESFGGFSGTEPFGGFSATEPFGGFS